MRHFFVACLTKISGPDEAIGPYYKPSSHRPLCRVNTDNRILAASFREVMEPLVADAVSPFQRGFIKGRRM